MSAKPWYAWYCGDWRAKTAALNLAQKGAYRELIDQYVSTGKPLPTDINTLCRIVGADPVTEITTVKTVIEAFFYVNGDGFLHHKRIDNELIKQKDFKEEQSRKGKLSAAARWGNKKVTEQIPVITESQPDCNLPLSQPLSQAIITTTKNKNKPRKSNLPESLERLEPSPRVQAWCERAGEKQIKAHLIYFVGYAKANGKQYADWDQAVINAIRADWAGIRKAGL